MRGRTKCRLRERESEQETEWDREKKRAGQQIRENNMKATGRGGGRVARKLRILVCLNLLGSGEATAALIGMRRLRCVCDGVCLCACVCAGDGVRGRREAQVRSREKCAVLGLSCLS